MAVAQRAPEGPASSTHWAGFSVEQPEPLVHRRLNIATDEAAAARLSRDARIRHRHGGDFVRPYFELLSDGQRRLTVGDLVQDSSLASLVAREAKLPPGAVVTLAVPVLESISQAHRRGFTHGALTLSACRVDALGKPWVEQWSSSIDLGELSGMRRDLALQDELRGLGRLCDALLAHSTVEASGQVRELVTALAQGAPVADPIPRLVDALFSWSTPAPVTVMAVGARAAVGVGSGVGAGAESASARPPGPAHPQRRTAKPSLGPTDSGDDEPLLEAQVLRQRGGPFTSVALAWRLVAIRASGIRPAVWLGLVGAGSAVALVSPLL
ncbi:hypothetical protein [Gulosibacter sp. ACHW.36C]|uniref:Protein kinase domain-containing protein n=1 Tax=Gulosibacter sediminis TaxID=1729695 RepID=A0ABY4MZZ2_9MICO|nr:hypothetical protein [Gulosibacter sediminis]UQN16025.1 hypothetical protein M3M28_06175 [Gulosibacter sediminis]